MENRYHRCGHILTFGMPGSPRRTGVARFYAEVENVAAADGPKGCERMGKMRNAQNMSSGIIARGFCPGFVFYSGLAGSGMQSYIRACGSLTSEGDIRCGSKSFAKLDE